jgi:hypothetical protein
MGLSGGSQGVLHDDLFQRRLLDVQICRRQGGEALQQWSQLT